MASEQRFIRGGYVWKKTFRGDGSGLAVVVGSSPIPFQPHPSVRILSQVPVPHVSYFLDGYERELACH